MNIHDVAAEILKTRVTPGYIRREIEHLLERPGKAALGARGEHLGGIGEKCRQTLDLAACSLNHPFEISDKLLVHRVVCCTEGVKRRRGSAVEDAEHAEVLLRIEFDKRGCPLHHERNRPRRLLRRTGWPQFEPDR